LNFPDALFFQLLRVEDPPSFGSGCDGEDSVALPTPEGSRVHCAKFALENPMREREKIQELDAPCGRTGFTVRSALLEGLDIRHESAPT
jgi:hypothetical protein